MRHTTAGLLKSEDLARERRRVGWLLPHVFGAWAEEGWSRLGCFPLHARPQHQPGLPRDSVRLKEVWVLCDCHLLLGECSEEAVSFLRPASFIVTLTMPVGLLG